MLRGFGMACQHLEAIPTSNTDAVATPCDPNFAAVNIFSMRTIRKLEKMVVFLFFKNHGMHFLKNPPSW